MNIDIKNLSMSYDNNKVLKDITLNIEDVKIVGIIGESGCGKSTLLRQLSGIETPDSGFATVNGTTITKETLQEYQSRIGVVFQKHNLFPHLSIKENITLILTKIKKMNALEASRLADNLLNDFHLTEQADKIPSKVSGGQAQRASIVRAIATNPELLFLDEPTAALDPLLTGEVLDTILDLKNKGSEFIFVTHEMDFLKKTADYFIFMDKGVVIESGGIEILQNPKTQLLQNFIAR
jgi:ABC-type polar amino acid transport system ATPase subunit